MPLYQLEGDGLAKTKWPGRAQVRACVRESVVRFCGSCDVFVRLLQVDSGYCIRLVSWLKCCERLILVVDVCVCTSYVLVLLFGLWVCF